MLYSRTDRSLEFRELKKFFMFWLLGSTDWEEFVKRQGSSELKIAAAQVVTNRSQSSVALPGIVQQEQTCT